MYIAELKISGIRGFHGPRAADLRFTRPDGQHAGWTVLAGRNGSGKTTLLRALALLLAGPSVARGLVPGFETWVSSEVEAGRVSGLVLPHPAWDGAAKGKTVTEQPVKPWIEWRLPRLSPSGRRSLEPSVSHTSGFANLGPWTENPEGWFVAGYGPFRRLGEGAADTQRLARGPAPVARLASLFREETSLVEGVRWLVDLHLRRLEGREGTAELLDFVIGLLNDGLLPDGFGVDRVDSDGLWVVRNGGPVALTEMSDGYRTVTALVLDLVRHAFQAFGTAMIGRAEETSAPAVVAPGVVLIDEIDVHLHVSWQKTIGGWLKRHFPNVQFIVTSHSPYICQSADPGGLIRLAGVDEAEPPRVVSEDMYERVVYGSGDDALLTELFGIDSPYSERAEEKRRRLAVLEHSVLRGTASANEVAEYEHLRATLTSSLAARVDEVAVRIG